MAEKAGGEPVRVLVKAMAVLDLLAEVDEMGLGDIATRLELNKSTCHRILSTLAAGEFVERPAPGTYRLGIAAFRIGNATRGWYLGSRLNADFTDRIDIAEPEEVSHSRLLNTRSYLGYSWDCCGLQLNYSTFNLPNGVRRESQAFVTFTLAGIGSIGNGNIGQPAQTRRLDRARGGRNRLDLPADESE